MAKCLYCYKELNGNERDFHKACSKKIFGTLEAPILPYTHNNLNDLARQVIRQSDHTDRSAGQIIIGYQQRK